MKRCNRKKFMFALVVIAALAIFAVPAAASPVEVQAAPIQTEMTMPDQIVPAAQASSVLTSPQADTPPQDDFWKNILSAFVQKFLEWAIPIVITAIFGVLAAAFRKLLEDIKEKKGLNFSWALETAAINAVSAVEQLYRSDQIEFDERLDKAVGIAQNYLSDRGYKSVNLDVLINEIESQVWNQINKYKDGVVSASTTSTGS